ncbi:MAG TPA: hypothetical protein VD947_00705 [Patescibacteria group bacterium]|nr:hypothetical protein [Patescibacteria group bacterium]
MEADSDTFFFQEFFSGGYRQFDFQIYWSLDQDFYVNYRYFYDGRNRGFWVTFFAFMAYISFINSNFALGVIGSLGYGTSIDRPKQPARNKGQICFAVWQKIVATYFAHCKFNSGRIGIVHSITEK